MSIQDRLTHAAAVAKWKADQQSRLLKTQGLIRDIENKIKIQKAQLADAALRLYKQEQLADDELNRICASIATFHDQKEEHLKSQENIKNENPPELSKYSSDYPPSQGEFIVEDTLGLVCPQCHRKLVGRFCPEHGIEGIPDEIEPQELIPGQRICPECKRPLNVQFCPEHGVEGILPDSIANFDNDL